MKKKVVLLGDSIRYIGYGARVSEFLSDDYEVFQPNENCRFAKYTLWGVIRDWAKEIEESDVVHWNNGLWDACDDGEGVFTPVEEYVAHMVRVAELLKKKGKVVIFATTTPVTENSDTWTNERIDLYNSRVVPVLQDMGILINDLHGLVAEDIDSYIRKDDNVHLTETGIEVCAAQVARAIREADRTE